MRSGSFCQHFTIIIRCKPLQGFEAFGEVIGMKEVMEILL